MERYRWRGIGRGNIIIVMEGVDEADSHDKAKAKPRSKGIKSDKLELIRKEA